MNVRSGWFSVGMSVLCRGMPGGGEWQFDVVLWFIAAIFIS